MDLARLRGLIVSCQAHGDHPLRDSYVISALAECAEWVAAAIRAEGHVRMPEQARVLFLPGAHDHGVGSAITNLLEITSRFADATREAAL